MGNLEYKNYNDISIVSSIKPQNTHLWIETDSGGTIYAVDSDDNTKLYKTTDKCDNWSLIETRSKKIARSKYDRTNGFIYFVDSNYDRTTSFVWYLDTSDDSIVEVDSAPDNIYDVFIIGTDVYMVYYSSVYSVETAILRPTGNVSLNWDVSDFSRIDEVIEQPTAGDETLNQNSAGGGVSIEDEFSMDSGGITLGDYDSGIITQLKIWAYHKEQQNVPWESNLLAKTDQTGATTLKGFSTRFSSYEWDSVSYTNLNWGQAELDNLQITMTAFHFGSSTLESLDTMYAIITFEGNESQFLYIKNITDDIIVSQSMGIIVDRSYDMGQVVVVGGDAYFNWKWSDEDVELWFYDESEDTITQVEDFGSDTNLPPQQQWALAYDGSNIISFVLGDGEEEESTLACAGKQAGLDDLDEIEVETIDENGEVIGYTIIFDLNGDETAGSGEIVVDCSGVGNDQDLSDAIQEEMNTHRYFAAGNVAGTSTTVTIQNVYNGAVTDISDTDSGITVAVTEQGVDNTYYYHTYNIDDDSYTKQAEYNVALMLNRNTTSTELEKAFHILEDKIYQLNIKQTNQLYLISVVDTDAVWIAITDTFAMNDDGDVYEYISFADYIINCDIEHPIMDIPVAVISFDSNFIDISEGMFVQLKDIYTSEGSPSIETIFEGFVIHIDGSILRVAEFESPAREIFEIYPVGDYSGDSDAIIISLLSDYCEYITPGTLSSGTAMGTITFAGDKTLKTILDGLAYFEGWVWYLTPTGALYFNDGIVDSTIDYTETSNVFIVISDKGEKPFNKIITNGAILAGVQLTQTDDDLDSQQTFGINRLSITFAWLNTQNHVNQMGDNLLTRLANLPILIDVYLNDSTNGFIQVGETITFQYARTEPVIASDQFIINNIKFNPKTEIIEYIISDNLL